MISQLVTLLAVATATPSSLAMARATAGPQVAGRQMSFGPEKTAEDGEVSVLLVEQLGAPQIVAVVRRTKGNSGKNMLVIKRSALTPEILVAGLKAAARSIKKNGRPDQLISIWILEKQRLPPLSDAQMQWAQSTIGQLRQAPIETADLKLGQRPTLHVLLKDVP